jgi:4-hydroxybenzoate polyprenyltransferase
MNFKAYLESIKFLHTIFAMPFALMGMVLAANGIPSITTVFFIIIAMIGARSGAMGFNRIADYRFDKNNPRTLEWPHIRGEITLNQLLILTVISYLIFIFAAFSLNKLCFYLSFPVILILSFYSLTKRITHFTHVFLGFAIGLAPVGAWIAVTGSFSMKPFLLSLVVMFWIAGFDIFYSLQDMEFDRKNNLFSFPVKFGIKKSLKFARVFHFIMFMLLLLMAPVFHLGKIFLAGVLITGVSLVYEHLLVKEDDLSKINKAFFTVNGWIAVILFLCVMLDVLL